MYLHHMKQFISIINFYIFRAILMLFIYGKWYVFHPDLASSQPT